MKRRTQNYVIIFALWLLVFSSSSQVIIVTPILPEIGQALDIPESLQSTLVTAYAVMLSVFALITGPVSDRIGRRRILLIGSGCMTAALWLHGLVDSYASLLTMRGLAGCGGGLLTGGAVAYVGDYFPYEKRGWANGWVMSGMAFGQIIGIPIGKILADAFGFRWPFLMFAATMTGAVALIWQGVPQPDVELDDDRLTVKRALLDYWNLLRRREVVAASAAYFFMYFSVGIFVVFLPTWLEQEIGLSGKQVALLFSVGGAANVVAGPTAGWLSDRIGRRPLIITSCVGMSVVMLMTTYIIVGFVSAAVLFALAMLMVAMRISPLQSLLTALVTGRRRGILLSLAVAIGRLGHGIGSSLAGVAYMAYGYFSNTLVAALSVVVMAVIVLMGLPEPARPSAESELH